jgi:hypothetical protein
MDNLIQRFAVLLRWLSALWLVAMTLYLAIWDNSRLATVEGTLTGLATLLIPAAVAFGISCLVERLAKTASDGNQAAANKWLAEARHRPLKVLRW